MTAPALPNAPLGTPCPCCGTAILDIVNISSWRGATVCMWCRSDLDDSDDARRAIASLYDRLKVRP